MSNWTEEGAKHKAMRRGQIDAPVVRGGRKAKAPKPYKVMFRILGMDRIYGRYASMELAEAVIQKCARSYYVSRQDQSQRAIREAQQAAQRRAGGMWIVGPGDIE